MHIVVTKTDADGKVLKYFHFDTAEEAEARAKEFPNAIVAPHPGGDGRWRVENGVVVVVPPPPPTLAHLLSPTDASMARVAEDCAVILWDKLPQEAKDKINARRKLRGQEEVP